MGCQPEANQERALLHVHTYTNVGTNSIFLLPLRESDVGTFMQFRYHASQCVDQCLQVYAFVELSQYSCAI